MKCNSCGLWFEESDLSQVVAHEHQIDFIMKKEVKGKKVIKHARDVYPNCSVQFACGVHTWINRGDDYDQRSMHQETSDFQNGFHQAQEELKDNYTIQH